MVAIRYRYRYHCYPCNFCMFYVSTKLISSHSFTVFVSGRLETRFKFNSNRFAIGLVAFGSLFPLLMNLNMKIL